MLDLIPVSYSKSVPISIGPHEKLLFMARTCVKYYIGDACEEGTKRVTQVDANGQPEIAALNVTICREHCTADGCNSAETMSALSKNTNIFYLVLFLLLRNF